METLSFFAAAIMAVWLWRKHTATAPGSTAAPVPALSPVFRVASGFIVGVVILMAVLTFLFVL